MTYFDWFLVVLVVAVVATTVISKLVERMKERHGPDDED